jgi:hypothetical protein
MVKNGLMNAIGTGRKACFLWDDSTYSKTFKLKTGRAQGDGPSPLQYNFAEQILLFKLELDPGLQSVLEPALNAARIPDPPAWFRPEVGRKINKVEALADDTTVVMRCNENSINILKSTLEAFGTLSGLECNLEKTNIMPVGGDPKLAFPKQYRLHGYRPDKVTWFRN